MCISSVLNMHNCNWYIYIDKFYSILYYGLHTKIRLDAWSLIRIEYEENCRGGSVCTEFASHSEDLGRDRHELLKHVVTAWKHVWVSQILRYNINGYVPCHTGNITFHSLWTCNQVRWVFGSVCDEFR